ncbi:MAG: cob(I)yrinic acid a,c-diamide adenosyltransferase [Clostridiales bacterium]
MSGLIHIYTGDGKGKTTAAVGLAIRAAGCGRQVVFVQFLKGRSSGEIEILSQIPQITILRNSKNYGFYKNLNQEVRVQIKQEHDLHLHQALALVQQGCCEMLILDEVIAAYRWEAVERSLLDAVLCDGLRDVELVLTGRNAPAHFIAAADYVSEINHIKHPFDQGIRAREGIEF